MGRVELASCMHVSWVSLSLCLVIRTTCSCGRWYQQRSFGRSSKFEVESNISLCSGHLTTGHEHHRERSRPAVTLEQNRHRRCHGHLSSIVLDGQNCVLAFVIARHYTCDVCETVVNREQTQHCNNIALQSERNNLFLDPALLSVLFLPPFLLLLNQRRSWSHSHMVQKLIPASFLRVSQGNVNVSLSYLLFLQ